ncbi:hypothetical protein O0S10_00430 [Methanocorpusculum sp. MG]|uniref:Uncharacterized protein n=1 Tax=Methanocorpusculum petauri TaxID=3002863 RepID=A0ABT4ID70_9EURY|nr:hypothetical protein [Methanocorpusculum petauri]MCZ0859689.1 hypothetical protein [Methanocorpusculum petauri]
MKETKKVWRTGKTAALLLLAVLLACVVIVPAAAENSSAVFTQQEIQGMMTAGSVFSDVFEDTLYNSLDDNAKADYMATVLGSLSGPSGSAAVMMSSVPGLSSANVNPQAQVQYQTQTNSILQQYDLSTYSEPLIDRESIYYDADAKTFTFQYSNGVLAMVKLVEDDCFSEVNEENPLTDMQGVLLSGEQSSGESLMRAVSGDKALLIYDWDTTGEHIASFDSLRYYLSGNNPSISSTVEQNPTVPQYRTLLSGTLGSGGYRVIVIMSHGGVYSLNLFTHFPSVVLRETTTDVKFDLYSSDLLQNRVGVVYQSDESDTFALLPSFFEYYYSGNKLGGAYVHLGMCQGFGNGLFADNTLASKFIASGAGAVTGYVKKVWYQYETGMCRDIIRNLVNGNSLQSSVNAAKSSEGNTGPNGEYIVVHGNGGWTL